MVIFGRFSTWTGPTTIRYVEGTGYTIHERQLLFGEVKSSLGACPGLSKTSYLACKTR